MKNSQKGFVIPVIVIIIALIIGSGYYYSQTTTPAVLKDSVTESVEKINDSEKNLSSQDNIVTSEQIKTTSVCSPSSNSFVCEYVTQGGEYDPSYKPPKVCGCKPASCPSDKPYLIISETAEKWSDNSTKGSFICNSDLPL